MYNIENIFESFWNGRIDDENIRAQLSLEELSVQVFNLFFFRCVQTITSFINYGFVACL